MKRGRRRDPNTSNKSLTSDSTYLTATMQTYRRPHQVPWQPKDCHIFREISIISLQLNREVTAEASRQLQSFRDIKCYNNTVLIILKLRPGLQRKNPPELHPGSERTEGLVMNFNSIILSGILLSCCCVDRKYIKTTPKSQLCSYFNPGQYASCSQHKPLSGNIDAVLSLPLFSFLFPHFCLPLICALEAQQENTLLL